MNAINDNKIKVGKDRAATEERLLEAAERVFAKYGFKGATTRLIAEEADTNIALINRYFNGKYGLLLSILDRKHQEFNVNSLNYKAQKTLTEEINHYLILKLHIFQNELNLFRLIMNQFLVDPKFLKLYRETMPFDHCMPELEKRIGNLVNRELAPKDEDIRNIVEEVEHYFFGLIIGELLIDGKEESVIIDKIKNFTRRYCASLEIKNET